MFPEVALSGSKDCIKEQRRQADALMNECVVLDCWIMVSRCALAPLPCGDVVHMGMLNTVRIYISGILQCTCGKEAWSKCTAIDDAKVLYLASEQNEELSD